MILTVFVIYESSKSAERLRLLEEAKERDFDDLLKRKNELSNRLEHQSELIKELRGKIGNYAAELGYTLTEVSQEQSDIQQFGNTENILP